MIYFFYFFKSKEPKESNKIPYKLPWDSDDETKSIISQSLMEKIFLIPLNDNNFTLSPDNIKKKIRKFSLEAYANVIMKIIQIDSNLASTHARISPNMDEETFWENYYLRVEFLRAKSGIEGMLEFNKFIDIDEKDVIYGVTSISSNLANSSIDSIPVLEVSNIDVDNDHDFLDSSLSVENNKIEYDKENRREEELNLLKEVIYIYIYIYI